MLSNPQIEERLAALGNRAEIMSILLEMLSGQNERQRQGLLEVRASIAAGRAAGKSDQAPPSEISPEMLSGNCEV